MVKKISFDDRYLIITSMVKALLILLIVVFNQLHAKAQTAIPASFTLLGKATIQTAKVYLIPVADSSFYPYPVEVLETEIIKGEFQFKGEMNYPGAFMLQIKNSSDELIYVSQMFFLDPGMQKIKCTIKNAREMPKIWNSTSEEYGKLKIQFDQIQDEIVALYKREDAAKKTFKNNIPLEIQAEFSIEFKSIVNKKDTILWEYTKQHPNSYVALWELVANVNSGYKPIYDSIYNLLSFQLKKTVTGIRLKKQLHSSAILNTGNKFPDVTLLNIENNPLKISIDSSKKYILIDFWFSNCAPCISQFSKLKELFYNHHSKFEIRAISVDDSAHVAEWKEVIAKFELPWKQYLDLGGKVADELSINAFPTNFLLDSKGKILHKDIGLEELQLLLEK